MNNSHDNSAKRSSYPDVAVLIPCYNEAVTIGCVVASFRKHLPGASIYVYDNNSTDDSCNVARQAGALVFREQQQGKGHVVRRMFADIDAWTYLLVDGDDTYDASDAPHLIEQLSSEQSDMIVARRISEDEDSYRFGHIFGNRLLTSITAWLFGARCSDMLSGYRVFSRRFIKSFPALSTGFEIEAELTIHGLSLHMPMSERDTSYRARPQSSESKLHTWRDGIRILLAIMIMTRDYRPLFFYSIACTLLALTSVALGLPLILEYLDSGLVPRFPTAILAASIMILAFLALATGLILDSVARGRLELKRLHYLSLPESNAIGGEQSTRHA